MLMMRSLAQEFAPHRVRVNGIAPGAIRTPINTPVWQTPKAYASLMELVPTAVSESPKISRVPQSGLHPTIPTRSLERHCSSMAA